MANGGGVANDPTDQPTGLTRARVVGAALDLIQQEGLDALSMRALADRLHIKAASLYWHVRDRNELLELLATSLLAEVRTPSTRLGWRAAALAACTALDQLTAGRRDAGRILLAVPDALDHSQAHATLSGILTEAGLTPAESFETATMMLSAVLVRSLHTPDEPMPQAGRPLLVAIDTGSRGVSLRAGANMTDLIRAAHDPAASSPAVIRGDRVTVRRLRGGRQGELELNPTHAWRFQVQGPTWNTVLNLLGLDLREVKIDSGAVRVECILPPPRAVVPIDISSGVIGVRLRRAPGIPVVADVSPGAIQLRLDGRWLAATTAESQWESVAGAAEGGHYRLKINSGSVRVTLEEDASIGAASPPATPTLPRASVSAALNVVLDGVATRSA